MAIIKRKGFQVVTLIVLVSTILGAGLIYGYANSFYIFGPKPVLLKAQDHPMQYYLSLPPAWTPAQKWPILHRLQVKPS